MDYKSLIRESVVGPLTFAELEVASVPPDGIRLLRDAARQLASHNAACFKRTRFDETLELSSYPRTSNLWWDEQKIRALVWPGDLVVEEDLVDDDFAALPLLIVKGNLTVRSWLRGGMSAFVGGHVRASWFIVGHYNDSALFVGGDLIAAGYVPRAKPYPDYRDVRPHQVAGRIDARTVDIVTASETDLEAAFVDEVLIHDEALWIDEKEIVKRSAAGLPLWR